MFSPAAMPFCTVCHNILMSCPCEDVPHGQCLDYRPYATPTVKKLENLRKYALCVESKSVSQAAGISFIRDQEKIDIISIIERNSGRLHDMSREYWRHGTEKIMNLANLSQQQVECFGQSAYSKFINMEWQLLVNLEIIMLNNSFQNADPEEYPTTDEDLKAIFTVITFILESCDVCPGKQENKGITSCVNNFDQVCFNCLKVAPVMKKCSVCAFATYCGTECSKKNWKQHKASCYDAKKIMAGEYPL